VPTIESVRKLTQMYPLLLNDKDLGAITQKLKRFITASIRSANARGAVVALSGGVDSSVVASLAHDAVDTLALLLPEKSVIRAADITHAKTIARIYRLPFVIIEIDPLISSFEAVAPMPVPHRRSNHKVPLAQANLKARIRMVLNYLVANLEHRLVLGTGNRTELLTGYFTKYGDGAVDVLPIGDLYKTQVFQLARYLGIPKTIISKAPSAGLWQGQTDEEELGFSYELLDRILFELVSEKKSVGETATLLNIETRRVQEVCGKVLSSRHKRQIPPVAAIN